MPLVIHPRARTALWRLAAVTGVAMFAGTGAAYASCSTPPVSTPFAQWGDGNSYFLAPGGSFEGPADQVGWTLDNADLTAGNEPFDVGSPSDGQSLTIDAGGTATSPTFCVDNSMRSLRFFAQQATAGSDLQVNALVQRGDGTPLTIPLTDLADGSASTWAPTAPILADTSSLADGATVQVSLQFSVPQSAGSWQLDDIYVDPYRSG